MNRVSSGVTRSKLDTKQRRTAYRSRRVSSSTILCRASLYMFTNTCIYIYITDGFFYEYLSSTERVQESCCASRGDRNRSGVWRAWILREG